MNPSDKMKFDPALKLMAPDLIEHLSEVVQDCNGTVVYLKLMRLLYISFVVKIIFTSKLDKPALWDFFSGTTLYDHYKSIDVLESYINNKGKTDSISYVPAAVNVPKAYIQAILNNYKKYSEFNWAKVMTPK